MRRLHAGRRGNHPHLCDLDQAGVLAVDGKYLPRDVCQAAGGVDAQDRGLATVPRRDKAIDEVGR